MCSSAASSALTASRSAVANDRLSDSGIRSASSARRAMSSRAAPTSSRALSSAARRAPSRQPVGRSRHDFVASRCDGAPRTVDRRRPAAAGTARGGPPLPARARRRRRRMLRGAPHSARSMSSAGRDHHLLEHGEARRHRPGVGAADWSPARSSRWADVDLSDGNDVVVTRPPLEDRPDRGSSGRAASGRRLPGRYAASVSSREGAVSKHLRSSGR